MPDRYRRDGQGQALCPYNLSNYVGQDGRAPKANISRLKLL